MSERFPIRIREATDADVGFVMKSWLETYRRESSWARRMQANVYYPNHRLVVTHLLESERTMMACSDEDPSHVVGFGCGHTLPEAIVMHFVYVSYTVRGWGISKLLAQAFGWDPSRAVVTSHWTRHCDGLSTKTRLLYNPYLLFEDHSLKEIAGNATHG